MNFDYKRLTKFEYNIGVKDKKIRMAAGIVLFAVSLFTAKVLLLIVGCALIATSFFGWCPVYSGFAKNTLDPEGTSAVEPAAEDSSDTH